MATVTICCLEFNNTKSSFISLPAILASEYQKIENASFELQWGDNSRVFVSWSGDVTRKGQNEMVVEINGLYGNKLGLQSGQQVLLKPISNIPSCVTAHIEPLTVDDWEILELHAGYVESQLLSQLRIVWTGQVFPFWVNKNICIFMKTGNVEPMVAQYAKLEQYTQVIVAPKSRLQESLQKPPRQQRSMLNGPGSVKRESDPQRAVDSGSVESLGQKTNELAENSSEKSRERPYDNVLKTGKLEWSLYPVWYASQLYNYFRTPQVDERKLKVKESEEDETVASNSTEFNGVDLDGINIVLRVHPMGDSTTVTESLSRQSSYGHHMSQQALSHDSHMTQEATSLMEDPPVDTTDRYSHLMQPTTVYINRDTLINNISDPKTQCQVEMMTNTEYSSFLAVLAKVPSPKERIEEYRKKLLDSEDKTKKNPEQKNAGKGKQRDDNQDQSSYVVRVIVCSDEYKTSSDYPYPTVSMATDCSSEDLVQVQDLFRRQLHLEVTGRVRLCGLHHAPSPVSGITLNPVSDLPKGIDHSEIIYAFQLWVACVSCMMYPLPINQGTLVRFPISRHEDHYGEFLITLLPPSGDTSRMQYFLLHPYIARKVKITVAEKLSPQSKLPSVPSMPCSNVRQLDPPIVGARIRDLGGVNTPSQTALDHLKVSLGIRPLANFICKQTRGLFNGGLLIHGAKGVGKSTLARALSREVSEWPYLCFTTIIQCKQLKGKRVENIRKLWDEAFQEAFWRQPSVIVLDDLDHVTSSPLGPEQELGPEAVYNTRVAQTLKDIILSSLSANHQVALIATSKSQKTIHPSLVATRGTHIFQNIIELTPPSAAERKEIFKSVIESKTEVDMRSINSMNLESIASKTEGYVARDIVMVVERAIHAASRRELCENLCVALETEEGTGEILLTDTDFHAALDNFTPLSLLNVPLHSAGKLGWQDVGGLTEVKRTLIETLELPAKYPALFSNCPLRLRSGLLLYGAPGTGKTLLAGIVAKECGLRFISIKGPELLSKYIGASEQAVRDMFTRAQSAKPCILFFDEFDSLAPRRGHDSTGVTDRVVNQLLTQLDGVESLDGVYVLAATSRPDLIDPALLRPGRLDKCLYCPLPGKEERLEILQALSRKMHLDEDVQLETLAEKCEGFTGADFKALLYNAQLEAIHKVIGYENYDVNGHQDADQDLEMIEVARKIEANDWQLTFMEANGENGFTSLEKCSEERQSFIKQMKESMQKHAVQQQQQQQQQPLTGTQIGDEANAAASDEDETDSKLEEMPFNDLQKVTYMPTVRDGILDVEHDVPSKVIEEVNIIRENYYHQQHRLHEIDPGKTDTKRKRNAIKISQEYLMNAAMVMRPSVSPREQVKYQMIYGNFVKSRGGDFGLSESTGEKRTTLA